MDILEENLNFKKPLFMKALQINRNQLTLSLLMKNFIKQIFSLNFYTILQIDKRLYIFKP